MPSSPPSPAATTPGTRSTTRALPWPSRRRILPVSRSATSAPPPGRNAIPHGASRSRAITRLSFGLSAGVYAAVRSEAAGSAAAFGSAAATPARLVTARAAARVATAVGRTFGTASPPGRVLPKVVACPMRSRPKR